MANPNPTFKWRKGEAPKGGRPKGSKDKPNVKALAAEQTKAAIEALANILVDDEAPHSARVAAAVALLDRGHGKPDQTSNLNVAGRSLVDLLTAGPGDTGDPPPADVAAQPDPLRDAVPEGSA